MMVDLIAVMQQLTPERRKLLLGLSMPEGFKDDMYELGLR
jgi:hypothetical protein